MGYSTLINTNFSGLQAGVSYSGTSFNQYILSSQAGQVVNNTIQTNNNKLEWFNGSPAPDPWGTMRSVLESSHFDLTLDMSQYPFYDGSAGLVLYLRATWANDIVTFPSVAYSITASNQGGNNLITWGDTYGTRKQITYTVPNSGKWRITLVDDVLSVYLNNVFVDNYDYSVGYTVNGTGKWGLLNYGPFTQSFNAYTIKADRRDNAF
jgi:hypothetical protein